MDTTLLQQIVHNTDQKQGFSILVSRNGSRIFTRFNPLPQLQFKESNTTLGFKRQLYTFDRATNGYKEGEYIVSIRSINSILVNSSIINGSYVHVTQQSTIYSFSPAIDPGIKIIQKPKSMVYLPVTLRTINRMQTYLTDQNGDPINLRSEHLTIRFHFREECINSLSKYTLCIKIHTDVKWLSKGNCLKMLMELYDIFSELLDDKPHMT